MVVGQRERHKYTVLALPQPALATTVSMGSKGSLCSNLNTTTNKAAEGVYGRSNLNATTMGTAEGGLNLVLSTSMHVSIVKMGMALDDYALQTTSNAVYIQPY